MPRQSAANCAPHRNIGRSAARAGVDHSRLHSLSSESYLRTIVLLILLPRIDVEQCLQRGGLECRSGFGSPQIGAVGIEADQRQVGIVLAVLVPAGDDRIPQAFDDRAVVAIRPTCRGCGRTACGPWRRRSRRRGGSGRAPGRDVRFSTRRNRSRRPSSLSPPSGTSICAVIGRVRLSSTPMRPSITKGDSVSSSQNSFLSSISGASS